MNFLAPMALWFAATIPVVILFYLLKRRRVVHRVSSTVLWQRFLAESQANAPFQKLRRNLLLLLQILLLLAAVLALARPYFAGRSEGGRTRVLILDGSASMQCTDESPSRFERARRLALQLVDSLHANDITVVLLATSQTEVKQSATGEKAALRRAIQSAKVADTPTQLKEALKLAETLVQNNPKAEVHLFSDGALGSLDEFAQSGLPLVFHRVGQRQRNVAITSLDVRANPENPSERAAFVNLVNYSTNAQTAELDFVLDDRLLETKSLALGPGESTPMVFFAQQERDGVFHVRLRVDDDLAVDNQASAVSLLPRPTQVLLISAGNRFLEKALHAVPHVRLTTQGSAPAAWDGFDLVVLDNVIPSTWPPRNTLAFRVAQPSWFEGTSVLKTPSVVDWKGNHPLLRFVSFDNVQIGESVAVKTPPWATSIVDSPQSSLLLAGELGRQRLAWVSFDALQSTWPLRISFPIFVANAVEWLSPAAIQAGQLNLIAGTPFRIALAPTEAKAEVQSPDGITHTVETEAAVGEIVFGQTLKQGVYQLRSGTNRVAFCVNLLNAAESNVEPKNELRLGAITLPAATSLRPTNLEIWRSFALVALALLLIEWWYYHRRTV